MRSARPSPPAHVRAEAPDFDVAHFRRSLGCFATGVTVVTTHAPETAGQGMTPFVGVTASSFNSVSLAPPLVLWSLDLQANCLPLFHGGSHYVINVLAEDQLEVCQRFAYGEGDRFAATPHRLSETGLPIIEGALAWFECHNRSRYEEGDHVIFVGEVERCGWRSDAGPLVFQGGRFGTVGPLPATGTSLDPAP
ncbi:MAG: flavin reductase family protein [Burkholderiaceae bacterium]